MAWKLIQGLDRLPWPWGEDLLASLFVAKALVKTGRLRTALAWASAQTDPKGGRWWLALSLCAYHGRFVARSALVGVRDQETLRRHAVVRGKEYLAAAGRAILLGFHLGPPGSDVVLRITGHRLTWLGGRRASRGWSRPAWRQLLTADNLPFPEHGRPLPSILYLARRILLDEGAIYLTADGHGKEAFRIPLAGGPMLIRSGWITLRRHTGAVVLPVLAHMDGRTQVVTVHPPLPPVDPDPVQDLASCQEALSRLLEDYLRRFPEQCYLLAFPVPGEAMPSGRLPV